MMEEKEEENNKAESAIDFFQQIGQLKLIKRTGWTRHEGISAKCESVAEHSFRIAMMALVFGLQDKTGLDLKNLISIALVHDICESIVGDITPLCGISKEEKRAKEERAMESLRETLGRENGGLEIERLWFEYENQESREAKVVKEMDKLEMLVQAMEYECAYEGVCLDEFYESCDGAFLTDTGKAWCESIVKRRPTKER
jgi:putative hydrolases of HD superfamily